MGFVAIWRRSKSMIIRCTKITTKDEIQQQINPFNRLVETQTFDFVRKFSRLRFVLFGTKFSLTSFSLDHWMWQQKKLSICIKRKYLFCAAFLFLDMRTSNFWFVHSHFSLFRICRNGVAKRDARLGQIEINKWSIFRVWTNFECSKVINYYSVLNASNVLKCQHNDCVEDAHAFLTACGFRWHLDREAKVVRLKLSS